MSLIENIISKPLYESQGIIMRELSSRAAFLIAEMKKDQALVKGVRLNEMRDAPDQQQLPMTRRDVERMLASYERREEAKIGSNPEARSISGAKRARWYAPEDQSNFADDDRTDAVGLPHDSNKRPAKLMPFDYYFEVSKSDTDGKESDDDWSGEYNTMFKESEDAAAGSVIDLFHDASQKSYPVEFHLDDNSMVSVDPEQIKSIIASGIAHEVLNYIGTSDSFQEFLDKVFDGEEQEGEDDKKESSGDIGDSVATIKPSPEHV
jgi:hypothetical protein